jgi:hypothetical protein
VAGVPGASGPHECWCTTDHDGVLMLWLWLMLVIVLFV